MSTQERWDVVLRVLSGPLAGHGDQVLRGPVIRVGANPDPGGLALGGYRGLDARHCVITVYDGGKVTVGPIGTNQVRLAPYAHVNWKDIEPLTAPAYISKGGAIHLGPVGRGATVEFVGATRLGAWEKGQLSPTSHRVSKVSASKAPYWFVGCLFLMASATATSLLAIGGFVYLIPNIQPLGPIEEGYPIYESVDPSTVELKPGLLEGVQQPFYDFVIAPNAAAAGSAQSGLENDENWDQVFLTYTIASMEKHVQAWSVFRRLESIRNDYATVTNLLRDADLPEVFAAIPYQESRYRNDLQSEVCADGPWQFMPEVALRVERKGGLSFRVRDCELMGRDVKWSPTELAPPLIVRENADYMDQGACILGKCAVDDRLDLLKSSEAAVYTLGEAYRDPVFRRSGAVVQLTIASHNAGYDDKRFTGRLKRTNLLPAYNTWIEENGADRGPHFYGESIRCPTHDSKKPCGSRLPAETQHYVYTIVAQHLLAVCYYAQNYGTERAFERWSPYVASDGYCRQFNIPTPEDVRRNKRSSRD